MNKINKSIELYKEAKLHMPGGVNSPVRAFKNINGNEDLIWIDTQGYEPKVLMGAENLIKSKAPIVIEFWPYELKRNGLWVPMFKILEKFDFFVDLSEKVLKKKKINSHSLNDLSSNWEKDKYKDSSLFTDFLLLKK